jgi:alpha-beta hydrolase superfamily lysophospholipase
VLTYDEAMARVAAVAREEEDPALNPLCRGYALTHGARAARCVLLLHGYTNCPYQYRDFAKLVHARGHNVYVPRMPCHGMADRLTEALAHLSAPMLLAWLDAALAVAAGLGARVDVLGISAGANLAAYAAQHRPAVHQAVIFAPVLGSPTVAAWVTPALVRASAILPNQFRWWDPERRAERGELPHAYPRFATRSLGAITGLGLDVLRDAGREPPVASDIALVINEADPAVTLPPIEELLARWRARGAPVREHRFPAALGLIHDLIDPGQPLQRVDLVYPALLELLGV